MKGRSSTVLFYAFLSLLFWSDSANSQNIGNLPAFSAGPTAESRQMSPPDFENIYVVRPGDNLIGISRIFDTNPEALKSANGLKGSKILVGQKLRVPDPPIAVAGEEASKEKDPPAPSYNIHTVRAGDSLIKISRMFDTSPEALKSANGLKNSKILIGQKLRIPVPPIAAAAEQASKTADIPAVSYKPSVISSVLLHRDQDAESQETVQPRPIQLVEAGYKLLGTRYRFGGYSEKYGFDCSGLVKNLFSKFTIDLPHSSREQFKCGEKVDRDKLEKGDLVFFSSGGKTPNHVGIYIGDDHFIHAARKADKVIISDLNKLWYSVRYLGARRITDLWWQDRSLTAVHN